MSKLLMLMLLMLLPPKQTGMVPREPQRIRRMTLPLRQPEPALAHKRRSKTPKETKATDTKAKPQTDRLADAADTAAADNAPTVTRTPTSARLNETGAGRLHS